MHTLCLTDPALLHTTAAMQPTSFSPVRNADKRRASFPSALCPRELSKTPWTFCRVPISPPETEKLPDTMGLAQRLRGRFRTFCIRASQPHPSPGSAIFIGTPVPSDVTLQYPTTCICPGLPMPRSLSGMLPLSVLFLFTVT